MKHTYQMKKQLTIVALIASLGMITACNSGGPPNTSNNINVQQSNKFISERSQTFITNVLDRDEPEKIKEIYNRKLKQFAVDKGEFSYYFVDNKAMEENSFKGRINFGNVSNIYFSTAQLQKFLIMLDLFIRDNPNSGIIQFKHVQFPLYEQMSYGKLINIEHEGYNPYQKIEYYDSSSERMKVTDSHQIINNQITIYFKKNMYPVDIKLTLKNLDDFLKSSNEKTKIVNQNISIGTDEPIRGALYTSIRNEKITVDGFEFLDQDKSYETELNCYGNYLSKELNKNKQIKSIYDLVKDYNRLTKENKQKVSTECFQNIFHYPVLSRS